MKLNNMIEILHNLENKGFGECEIFIDENQNIELDDIEITYNAKYDTVDIKFST